MERRRASTNTHFNKVFAALGPSEAEIEEVIACLKSLESKPEEGAQFRYDLLNGIYSVVELGRFVLVYQFSDTEVRAKDILLGERWL